MKQPVTARTVNYELDLLRGLMKYTGCWAPELMAKLRGFAGSEKPGREICIGATSVANHYNRQHKSNLTGRHVLCSSCIGTGCRGGEIRTLQLRDINLAEGIEIRPEKAKNRTRRYPRLMAVAGWGLRNLLERAHSLGATKPEHYLLPLSVSKSRIIAKTTAQKWDVTARGRAVEEGADQRRYSEADPLLGVH